MRMMTKRDHIIETAIRLFNAGGFHAVGVDAIVAEAGVAKMTLYKHFPSKDELIVAALDVRDERFRTWLTDAVQRASDEPRGRLLAVFDAVQSWYRHSEFNGCVFAKACGEFPEGHPAREAGARHLGVMRGTLRELASDAGAADPAQLADRLLLLFMGATAAAQMSCSCAPAGCARSIAELVVDEALPVESAG